MFFLSIYYVFLIHLYDTEKIKVVITKLFVVVLKWQSKPRPPAYWSLATKQAYHGVNIEIKGLLLYTSGSA